MGCLFDFGEHGERRAVVDDQGRSLSYAELSAFGRAVFEAAGGRCLVVCLCENSLGALAGYVGLLDGGAATLPLSAALDSSQLWPLICAYRPRVLWAPAGLVHEFMTHDGFEVVYEALGYCLLRTGFEEPELHEDLCQLIATSGSTGSPKLVRLSYASVRNFIETNVRAFGLTGSERFITITPMYYFLCVVMILTNLSVGSTILITGASLMQREFWDFFAREGATDMAGVPYTFEMLERLRFYRRELPSLRMILQSGGKLAPELHERLAAFASERGVGFIVAYGQCESACMISCLPAEMALAKKGSAGIALPGCEIELLDSRGAPILEPDVAGELVFHSPGVAMGYALRAEDLARGDEFSGVLDTGDVAYRDAEGFYYIVGRKKRFVKVYGNRVSLDEIDRIVASELGIECASAGEDDHIVLYVTDASKAEAAHALVAERTRLYPGAFEVVVLDSIPKNETGKVLFAELGK